MMNPKANFEGAAQSLFVRCPSKNSPHVRRGYDLQDTTLEPWNFSEQPPEPTFTWLYLVSWVRNGYSEGYDNRDSRVGGTASQLVWAMPRSVPFGG